MKYRRLKKQQQKNEEENGKKKKETSNNVLVLLWTLVCCSAKPTAVESYLFIWIYFYEVCYWSEFHIYFVNHECLCYKFVYFNNKCHTKQTCWYKTWIRYFKAFGPLSLGKQIYGTIQISTETLWFLIYEQKITGFVFWFHVSSTHNLLALHLCHNFQWFWTSESGHSIAN